MEKDSLLWLQLNVIYPLTSSFNSNEEVSEVEQIRLRNEGLLDDDQVETGVGYYNLARNGISQLNPKCFVPKGKVNKKYYTEIYFDDGDVIYALGKPSDVYEKINAYYASLPAPPTPQ